MVSLEEAKNYLRIDNEDDDGLIQTLLDTSVKLCTDISRCDDEEFSKSTLSKTAVLYTLGYLYEHREDADHHDLTLTLRSLLFSLRDEKF